MQTEDVSTTAGSDYTGVPLTTLTFAPGETTKLVNVTVLGDAAADSGETFKLNLKSPIGATISGPTFGVGTIIEPSAPPALSIGDVTVAEDGGTATLLVKISRAPDSNVSVNLNSATDGDRPSRPTIRRSRRRPSRGGRVTAPTRP